MKQRGFIYVDGGVYEGDWDNDKANGYGIYTRNGRIYEGEWRNDLQNGYTLVRKPYF